MKSMNYRGFLVLFFLGGALLSGVFLISQRLSLVNHAYTSTSCQQEGGVAWVGSQCPQDSIEIGKISQATRGQDDGETGQPAGETGSQQVCCKAVLPTQPKIFITPEATPDTSDTPTPISNLPTEPPTSCQLPQPTLLIECPYGCVESE